MSGWIHSDPRGFEQAFAAASKRVASGAWDTTPAGVADVRALLAVMGVAAAGLSTAKAPGPNAVRAELPDFLAPNMFSSAESAAAAGAFLRTIPLLSGGGRLDPRVTLRTSGGDKPVVQGADAQGIDYWQRAIDIAEIAALGPVGLPLMLGYAAMDAQRIAAELSGASGDVAQLLIYLDALRVTVALHQAGELKVGREYAWTEPERRVLNLVLDAQRRVAERKNLTWLVPRVDPFSFLRPNVEEAAKGAWTLAKIFAVGAGLGLVGWIAWEMHK